MAWHLDVPEQDSEMIVIDEDIGNPIRARLLGQANIQHTRLSLLRSSTMERVLRLLARGRRRGTWARLRPAATSLGRHAPG